MPVKMIRYKTEATVIAVAEAGQPGDLIRKPVHGTVEVPYSEAALEYVKSIAGGGYEVVDGSSAALDSFPDAAASQDRIRITEQGTGKTYVLYVEDGKLMMEVE